MNRTSAAIGHGIVRFLEKQTADYMLMAVASPERMRATLRPGDVVLVEGNSRISSAIKYLTQSMWSHAAMFVGDGEGRDLIEADLKEGVRYIGLDHLLPFNLRICRPVGLTATDRATVLNHMRVSLGRTYDLKNVVDLARFLLPEPPVPKRFRRRMLALGSGDPTRAICSTLIAEAFEAVRFPILPRIETSVDNEVAREIWHIRHHSLFAPRDFDVSPYFAVIKPTIEGGFDYRAVSWSGPPGPDEDFPAEDQSG
ncbi:MAG: YiiX/YebB-like N1pC/P60 family cysteine hydrolase [Rhodobacterales bacterium]|nr:YiiX/YebB-like N1pC/P60 family cysteine hydrolase [Rhodobacterales bacterium]